MTFHDIPRDIDRKQYWSKFINDNSLVSVAEVGVWKGDFAKQVLDDCPNIRQYYLIDPWEKLDDWNKPLNFVADFNEVFDEVVNKLQDHKLKTKVLRGKTIDMISQIPDKSLDFAYIDGDHTLKGIAIDLISILPKMKEGSFIGLDDFAGPFQHGFNYELSLVDPFALYFAQANHFPCARLSKNQFCIHVKYNANYSMIDFVDPSRKSSYPDIITRMSKNKFFKIAKSMSTFK